MTAWTASTPDLPVPPHLLNFARSISGGREITHFHCFKAKQHKIFFHKWSHRKRKKTGNQQYSHPTQSRFLWEVPWLLAGHTYPLALFYCQRSKRHVVLLRFDACYGQKINMNSPINIILWTLRPRALFHQWTSSLKQDEWAHEHIRDAILWLLTVCIFLRGAWGGKINCSPVRWSRKWWKVVSCVWWRCPVYSTGVQINSISLSPVSLWISFLSVSFF